MLASDYFSADYTEARFKFREACIAAGAEIDVYELPISGPQGDPLSTEVCILGPDDADTALLLSSGTHGVEGVAGSAIQVGLLNSGIERRVLQGLRIIMVHAINPYGFAYLRRVNENNVDLNRNFLDHSKSHPKNSNYDALARAIAPNSYTAFTKSLSVARLSSYRALHGTAALQAAISRGQYEHSEGLFYGGRSETWSNKTFRSIVRRHLPIVSRVAFVDFHTGLGPYGVGECIQDYVPGSPAHERANTWWGNRARTTRTGEAVGIELTGAIKFAVSDMLADREVTSVTLEFGTVPPMKVFLAMQAENWLHHHGGEDNPKAQGIKAEMRRVFYPEADDWKEAIWKQGKEVVDQAIEGLIS